MDKRKNRTRLMTPEQVARAIYLNQVERKNVPAIVEDLGGGMSEGTVRNELRRHAAYVPVVGRPRAPAPPAPPSPKDSVNPQMADWARKPLISHQAAA